MRAICFLICYWVLDGSYGTTANATIGRFSSLGGRGGGFCFPPYHLIIIAIITLLLTAAASLVLVVSFL